ncbi:MULTISPECIES: BON domain-containing protein [Ralstonia]|nr:MULTISPECIES: BON domain-containing protein [Ralstonia]MBY4705677.1 BON domain-containing protein [Ralstonia insidiosa]
MRFPSLSLVVRAGMPRQRIGVLAAIGAASVLTACAWGDGPDRTGARMTDDSLLSYQVKAALDQDTALNTRQIRIHTTPEGKVTLTGWVDSAEMARRAGEDVKRFVDPAKLDNQLRILSRSQVLGGGPLIPAGLPPAAPASAPAAR